MSVIAIDIDDVLADYVLACCRRYGWPAVWSPNLREMWPNVNWAEHFDPLSHNAFIIGLQPIGGAKEALTYLVYTYDLLYLTASKEESRSVRQLWLKIHGFPQARMVCTGSFKNKAEWLQENAHEVNALIEDLPMVLDAAHEAGIYTICFNTPWNTSIRYGKRVYGWGEISKLFRTPEMP